MKSIDLKKEERDRQTSIKLEGKEQNKINLIQNYSNRIRLIHKNKTFIGMWTQKIENDIIKASELSNAQKQIESLVI